MFKKRIRKKKQQPGLIKIKTMKSNEASISKVQYQKGRHFNESKTNRQKLEFKIQIKKKGKNEILQMKNRNLKEIGKKAKNTFSPGRAKKQRFNLVDPIHTKRGLGQDR
ncbi:MAG: hypothetical protein CM15mV103_260 [uncultured marine virus]|nr:MAG: hypothetical protein CM15mV103_260 [uncultured marine virus]